MITALAFLLQATATPVAPGPRTLGPLDQARFETCYDTAIDDPAAGVNEANRWIGEGGGFLARQCLGFAHSKAGNFAGAEEAFAQAAHDAETARDWRAANLWAQAGNAALAAGDPETARMRLDAALAQGRLTGQALGLATLDRGRAALAMEDWAAGRADLDAAAALVPNDPLVWLLSATLARRQNDLPRAQADIQQAAALGPRDAAIALEAGNIAAAAERWDAARASWESAVALGGAGPQAVTARDRLAELTRMQEDELMHISTRPANPLLSEEPIEIPPQPTPQSR
jgi:tetratricopeptide (TPR) repeat protein